MLWRLEFRAMKQNLWLVAICAAITLSGCAESKQAGEARPTSGFLGENYPLLSEGSGGEALLVYRREGVNWTSYDRVRLRPVTIWAAEESSFEDFSPADRQQLADCFYAIVQEELAKDYELVSTPADGVLDIQIALTDAQASNPTLDTVSTVVPQALVVSSLTGLVTGKPAFVGEAQAELKMLDGGSGDLLAAVVDRRVGGKSISSSTDSWGDVEAAFQYWAQQLRYRLCTERGGADCVAPGQEAPKGTS
jgi:hypothetical protein